MTYLSIWTSIYPSYDLLMIHLSIWAPNYPTYDSLILLRTVVYIGVFGSSSVLFIDNSIQQRGTVVGVLQPMAQEQ